MTDVVNKLWGFCHILRHDGIDYGDYIEQMTYLLFLKMADERGIDLPEHTDWPYLRKQSGTDLLDAYIEALRTLGKATRHPRRHLQRRPESLHQSGQPQEAHRPDRRDRVDLPLDTDVKAAAFEGLLEKAASEGKKGAGQYFTPRLLIQCDRPLHQARSAGQQGLHDRRPGLRHGRIPRRCLRVAQGADGGALDRDTAKRIRTQTYYGQELVARPRRLALMNLYLHQVEPHITLGDSIYEVAAQPALRRHPDESAVRHQGRQPSADRDDFVVQTSNKQLNFIQHVLTILKPGGRAAVVVPDNVLFAEQAGEVFQVLMEDCDVHTVLRCPRGTFSPYTEGTKTNVIFFTKGRPTERTWIYDARANVPKITKKSRPLTAKHFAEFEKCYGDDPNGPSKRSESDSADGRWRSFTIDEVKDTTTSSTPSSGSAMRNSTTLTTFPSPRN